MDLEEQVRQKLNLDKDDEIFVWFVDHDGVPITYDLCKRLVYVKSLGKILHWDEIFDSE